MTEILDILKGLSDSVSLYCDGELRIVNGSVGIRVQKCPFPVAPAGSIYPSIVEFAINAVIRLSVFIENSKLSVSNSTYLETTIKISLRIFSRVDAFRVERS